MPKPSAEMIPLLRHLLRVGAPEHLETCTEIGMEPMEDGGMGSHRFTGVGEEGRVGRTVAECEFTDEDGVTVSAALNVDQRGRLLELDIWKTDFSPLMRWPLEDGIRHRDCYTG